MLIFIILRNELIFSTFVISDAAYLIKANNLTLVFSFKLKKNHSTFDLF